MFQVIGACKGTFLKWKLLMLTHLSIKIVTHIFFVGGMQDANIFECKTVSEFIFLGLNLTLHTVKKS